MIKFAWERNFLEIVLDATSKFLSLPWLVGSNKEVSAFAAQAHFMRAQALLTQKVCFGLVREGEKSDGGTGNGWID